MNSCSDCLHSYGEGTILFCQLRRGAAYDATAKCDWWTHYGDKKWKEPMATITAGGLTFSVPTSETFLIEDAGRELNLYGGPLDVVVDVGAHVGTFSIQAAQRGARVYAVEPSPENAEVLRHNIERNGFEERITVIQKAVAVESGRMVPLRDGGFPGQKSICFHEGFPAECEVETISLANLISYILARELKIDFVKVDIEGEEFVIADDGPVEELGATGYVSISLHTPTNTRYFGIGDGRTDAEYYEAMVKWLKGSGFENAKIDNNQALGIH